MKRALLLAALLLFAPPARGTPAGTVVVLKSANLEIYREPVASFREALPGVSVVELSLGGRQDAVEGALAEIDSIDPDLVFALGTRAANACRNADHARPTLFAMVLNWERHSLRTDWMSGVAMEIPFGAQFFGFRLLLPGVHSVGLIYDPASTAEVFRRAAAEASEYGIEIVPRTLHAPEGSVSAALLGLSGVDAVWMIPDPTVYTESNFLAIRNWCL